jgi:hypothetical protein
MLRRKGLCLVAALTLVLTLGGPVAGARAAVPGNHRIVAGEGPAEITRIEAILERARAWLAELFPWASITAAECDRIGSIDPNGQCG